MKLEPYELRSPAALIEDVTAVTTLTVNCAYLVLVADPSTRQCIARVEQLTVPGQLDDWPEARDEMYERIRAWAMPEVRPPTHAGVLVVVRRGLCVMGHSERNWFLAWRYVNHARPMYSGGVILVTEHGWFDFMTQHAGLTPALACLTKR